MDNVWKSMETNMEKVWIKCRKNIENMKKVLKKYG